MRLIATTCPGPRGFTLIELLIVVAIIAILAAITVPNLLEAQTRGKVSRVVSDMRTLAAAIEAYRVDQPGYPVVGNPNAPSPFDLYTPYGRRLRVITTPVAYITSLPKDPFHEFKPGGGPDRLEPYYSYAPGNLYAGASPIYSGQDYRNTIYSLGGRGPDRVITVGGYCMAHPSAFEHGINIDGSYDPTNGVVSKGDIIRLGAGVLTRQGIN